MHDLGPMKAVDSNEPWSGDVNMTFAHTKTDSSITLHHEPLADDFAMELPVWHGNDDFLGFCYDGGNNDYGGIFRSPGDAVSVYGSPIEYGQTSTPLTQHPHTPMGPSIVQHAPYSHYQQAPPGPSAGVYLPDPFQEGCFHLDSPSQDSFAAFVGHDPLGKDFSENNEQQSVSYFNPRPRNVRRVSTISEVSTALSPSSVETPQSGQGLLTRAPPNHPAADIRVHRQRQHERNRQKNRTAAAKCRERSKTQSEDLRKCERELAMQNRQLSAVAAELKGEVLALKNEILRHGNCDCEFIQKYLTTAAQHIV